ncbi:MAG: hypothetical protein NVV82_17640 [Sporocytophaga sp.]|nr:hypothetical protein [Sporocytophaga sp.]
MKKINQEVLKLYDDLNRKYDGDLGLLDERWASKADQQAFARREAEFVMISQYIEELHFLNVKYLSEDLKNRTVAYLKQLECNFNEEVIVILRNRILLAP